MGATGKAGSCCLDQSFAAAIPSSLSQSTHERDTKRGVGKETTRFHCKHKGCDKVYRSPDRVRKHCRAEHREWFNKLLSTVGGREGKHTKFGPSDYCTWKQAR